MDYCLSSPETGTCRGEWERWYFDTESGECKTFIYGGCDGNRNNFETKEKCETDCMLRVKNIGKVTKMCQ